MVQENLKNVVYDILGLHCASCVQKIQQLMNRQAGIKNATVSFAAETLTLEYEDEVQDFHSINALLKEHGYSILPKGHIKPASFKVKGMTCTSCARNIEKALNQLEGLNDARVNFASETLMLHYDTQQHSLANIVNAVQQLGYHIEPLETKTDKKDIVRFPFLILALLLPLELITVGRHFFYPQFLETQPLLLVLLQFFLSLGIFYSARGLLSNGMKCLFYLRPNMNSLISIGTITSLLYSIYLSVRVLLGAVEMVNDLAYETGSLILFLVLLGQYFENRSKHKGRGAITALAELQPDVAHLQRNGKETDIPIAKLHEGDLILVKKGERIPADGTIVEGEAWIDQSVITGESLAVHKLAGDNVVTGALNQGQPFLLSVDEVGENTTLARITNMVLQAQGSQMPISRLADRISGFFVPVVITLALISALSWYFINQNLSIALTRFVAVLIVSCPCALGLASPMSVMLAIGKGMKMGFIIRQGEVLERLKQASTLVFDKTGTLTKGKPAICDIFPYNNYESQHILSIAASGESYSEHPLAQAVLEMCKEKNIEALPPKNFESVSGRGIRYDYKGDHCLLGSLNYLKNEGVELSDLKFLEEQQSLGKTLLGLAVNQTLAGVLAVRDPLKESSKKAIGRLHDLGYETILLSGDNSRTANAVGAELGIKRVIADVLPEDKQNLVKALEEEKDKVVMVGDGVNDAPALAQAYVGLAMGSGSQIAHESGDVILMNDDPFCVVQLLRLGHATVRTIKQNLFWAFTYNIVTIPLAAGVLWVFGFPALSPIVAAPIMALSSLIVVGNSFLLEKNRYN